MSIFRTRDRKYCGGSTQEIHFRSSWESQIALGEFSFTLVHCLIFYILGFLCHVAMLAFNVATSQRRDVSTSRRQFDPPLERRDVGSQRRDVGLDLLWNVATVDPNVATSFLYSSGTS